MSPHAPQPAGAASAEPPPQGQHDPQGGPGATPVVVMAPALEALKAVPAGRGQPQGGAAHRGAPTGAARPESGPGQAAPPVPDIPEPPRPPSGPAVRHHGRGHDGGAGGPQAELERQLVPALPVRPADVCALGRKHGRWQPDSPEARICAGVQGG
ncbi:hypothetical protein OHS33_05775 [Streptomyces sp. NBC_00536]|uniref:hypothetical protein n=1 Tax=Streptomyces sp. NBC_00536 TaxID=2975769 RepID=UPI002E818EA4|nr:hypothetical protein [Streptomyces sp. NBC_00536]WUC77891.1 hypothetical protein OHS33_05775 [Streptomyces sp. NBC_00536]